MHTFCTSIIIECMLLLVVVMVVGTRIFMCSLYRISKVRKLQLGIMRLPNKILIPSLLALQMRFNVGTMHIQNSIQDTL